MSDRTNQLIDPKLLSQVIRRSPHGNTEPRGLTGVGSAGSLDLIETGRFGRMFPRLPAHQETTGDLERLGNSAALGGSDLMVDKGGVGDSKIPSGFTYFGQFIDHDMTFDPTSSLDKQNDPSALVNFRTPRFDLDNLYGGGPADSPFLFDQGDEDSCKFLLGQSVNSGPFSHPTPDAAGDHLRNTQGTAMIGDPRNDENLIVAQLHRQFLKFHNRVVDWLRAKGTNRTIVFSTAQQLVRWHYQWVVVNDYLPRVVGPDLVKDILRNGRRFYNFRTRPFIPVEFSVAAFRFGHTMVRDDYRFHRAGTGRPFPTASLGLFFQFTHQETTPINWVLHPDDWENFFETNAAAPPLVARGLDTRLSPGLHNLPFIPPGGGPVSLATRNLVRGLMMGLPSGQSVAKAMGEVALTPAEIEAGDTSGFLKDSGLSASTPLWYYILREAQAHEGMRLGAVGGRIVAEVIIGLLQGDRNSYLNIPAAPIIRLPTRIKDLGDLATFARAEALAVSAPMGTPPLVSVSGATHPLVRPDIGDLLSRLRVWRPVLPAATPGTFTMADLIKFANH